jgi:hypothetical protein
VSYQDPYFEDGGKDVDFTVQNIIDFARTEAPSLEFYGQ